MNINYKHKISKLELLVNSLIDQNYELRNEILALNAKVSYLLERKNNNDSRAITTNDDKRNEKWKQIGKECNF